MKVRREYSLRQAQGRHCPASVILNSLFAVVLQWDEEQRPLQAEGRYLGPFGGTTEVVPFPKPGIC
jgi:hypothetical protein